MSHSIGICCVLLWCGTGKPPRSKMSATGLWQHALLLSLAIAAVAAAPALPATFSCEREGHLARRRASFVLDRVWRVYCVDWVMCRAWMERFVLRPSGHQRLFSRLQSGSGAVPSDSDRCCRRGFPEHDM